jgi:hypothetical protein
MASSPNCGERRPRRGCAGRDARSGGAEPRIRWRPRDSVWVGRPNRDRQCLRPNTAIGKDSRLKQSQPVVHLQPYLRGSSTSFALQMVSGIASERVRFFVGLLVVAVLAATFAIVFRTALSFVLDLATHRSDVVSAMRHYIDESFATCP